MITKYYPQLSDIVQNDDLPEVLNFVKNGIQELLDNLYYDRFQHSNSKDGNNHFYSLNIISTKRLSLELPGTGIFFLLNPDHEDSTISSFPITILWEWKVISYVRDMNLSNFSFSVDNLFNLAIKVFNINEKETIEFAVANFVIPTNQSVSKINQFVNDINTLYGTSIITPTQTFVEFDESIKFDSHVPDEDNLVFEELLSEINQQAGATAYLAVLSLYILTGDINEQKEKLNTFFSTFLPQDIEEYIRELLIPKAKATLELSAGLEFPRNMLKPVYDENGISPFDPSNTGIPFEVIPEDDQGILK